MFVQCGYILEAANGACLLRDRKGDGENANECVDSLRRALPWKAILADRMRLRYADRAIAMLTSNMFAN